ncbi:pilus assembly protein [Actinotalea sp. M2MS4P-6]|uniref:TadE/TadG family type IV pilus assembly protein n=1 Tax=Actinotalea sp. M2MS4P-6 TaxID=2983762 RepID=UPI0021E49037|nr:pilus assembly protein [Actinotalea sp. M2MS4P-6]MCV2393746.1 pilus assembly protein [Actinotalea sp. M2MS4P-6]
MTRALRTHRTRAGDDAGNAIVEFLGVALLLLVPAVYLVLVVGRLQAASFAVDGAAREAVRAVVAAPTSGFDPESAAVAAVQIALGDQKLVADDPLQITCVPTCDTPDASVIAYVSVHVPLPLVPAFVQDKVPLEVPVAATAQGRVGELVDAP